MRDTVYLFLIVLLMNLGMTASAQGQPAGKGLPYREIPTYPEHYSAGTVTARMVDALGFRYYWATEGLSGKDLGFKPSDEASTTDETLDHIHSLSQMIVNATLLQPNDRSTPGPKLGFEEKRQATLLNLQEASNILRKCSPEDIETFKVVFKTTGQSSEHPFWNLLNGPIADALWHTGQVVSFRRSSGNPIDSRVNVFAGKLRE